MASGDGAAQRLRRAINREGGSLCGGCFEHYPSPLIRVDHRVALFLGGHDVDENVWPLCITCHDAKTRAEKAHLRTST